MAIKAKNDAPAEPKESIMGGCRRNVMRALAILLVFLFGVFLVRFGVLNFLFGGEPPISINLTTMLERIQFVSELTTVRYTYSNIITSERDLPPILAALYRDRLVLVAVGYVTSGIDLSKLSDEDVSIDGQDVRLTLPPPELFDCFLSESESYVASRETGFFAAPAPDLDLQARRFAIRYFRNQSLEKGILNDAARQAEAVMAAMLEALYPGATITVGVRDVEDTVVMPTTCQ